MNSITNKTKVSRLILAVLLMLTVVSAIGCGKKTTPSEKPTVTEKPTENPTENPTSEPTKEPTPTVTEEPKEPVITNEYGDITQYLDKPAGDVTSKFGQEYQYLFSNRDYQTDYFETIDVDPGSASGVMYYDQAVFFSFTDSQKVLKNDCAVRAITVKNDAKKTLSVDIGNGLNIDMTFSQLKAAMGDSLVYEAASGTYMRYRIYGIVQGYRYFFCWKRNPMESDKPADYAIVSLTALDNVAETVAQKTIDDFYDEHEEELAKHKEQYLRDLRNQYKGVPVYALEMLATKKLDEKNAIEIYEIASFGCASTWKETEYSYEITGINSAEELLGYTVFGRLVTDGKSYGDPVYEYDTDIPWGSWDENSAYATVRLPGHVSEDLTEDICKMVDLPYSESDDLTVFVSTDTWVSDNYVLVVDAKYINGEKKPFFYRKYNSYRSNDGGMDNLRVFLADGTEVDWKGAKKVKEGHGTVDGKNTDWFISELPNGQKIVYVYYYENDPIGAYSYDYYFYVDGKLIHFYGEFVL